MKRLLRAIKSKEERDKQYWRERNELDKAHGRYKSPVRRIVEGIASLALSILLFIMMVPLIAGMFYLKTSEYINVEKNGKSELEIILEENVDRLSVCLDIDEKKHKDQRVNCFINNMNKGEIFTTDLVTASLVANHAIESKDRELAKVAMNSLIWMEGYRDYDDVKFDAEFIRGIDMVTRSIGYIAIEWIIGQEILPEDLSTTKIKMGMLNETKEKLVDEFNFSDAGSRK